MATSLIPDTICDIPVDNVKYIKRKLIVHSGGDNIYIACFCKDEQGVQLPAIKTSKNIFYCQNKKAGSKTTPCGFQVSAYAVKFIKDGDLMREPFGEITVPICGSCGYSVLQVVYSSPIKDFIGLAGYTCQCTSYKDRIDIPLTDKSISSGWYIANYLSYREKVFGDMNPKLRVLNSQIKTDDEPKQKKTYIPLE